MLKFLFLGLLAERSRYGYELRAAFEDLLGGTWPLNPGQVYAALGRLESDGLVQVQVVPQDLLPDRKVYSLTEDGRRDLKLWTEEPVDGPVRVRDELYVKLLALGLLGGDRVADTVWKQRQAHMQSLARLTKLRAESLHPAAALLLDGAILRTEADLKWLDLCEDRLVELDKESEPDNTDHGG